MSVNTQVNTFALDFPIQRESSIGENTGVFVVGTFYPTSTKFASATLDFGDGTTTTILLGNKENTLYNKLIGELTKYVGFFPEWQESQQEIARIAAPAFTTTHTYDQPGTYNVHATLTTTDDISYTGSPSTLNVVDSFRSSNVNGISQLYNLPDGWSEISDRYTVSDGASLLFNRGELPSVTTNNSNIKEIPQSVIFSILNIQGRIDIDYIEWIFGDGSTSVTGVYGTSVTPDLTNIEYQYSLLPFELSYKPSAVLYITKGGAKYKVIIPSPEIVFQDRSNINVSLPVFGTSLKTYGFNLIPSETDTLPRECTFIAPVTRELKYIFWNHDDGTYDVTPVRYDETRTFLNQYITHKHTYTSHNINKMLPGCILVFQDASGNLYSEYHRSRNYLNYDKGLINKSANYFIQPIYGVEGFAKFNNITILPVYKTNSSVDVYLRVSLAYPSQIYLFEKIIWTINGIEIVHNKNTTKDFGYLVLENVPAPYINFSITASIYGIPAIFAKVNVNEVVFYDSYSYTTNILSYSDWLVNRESLYRILTSTPQPEPPILPPTVTTVDSAGNITIITPVIESTSTKPVTSFIALTGVDISFNKLFSAASPASNFLNRDFPSTASTGEYTVTVPKREVGFFTPTQTSNIIVEPGQFTFTVEAETLDFNKPYYFPDPFKYGSDTPALTFSYNEDSFKNGSIFTIARNRPNTSDNFITFDGYTSLKPLNTDYDIDDVVNKGYFHNFADDIYGNRYGLVKPNNFQSNVKIGEKTYKYTVVFNGYKFFDSYFGNGYNFNYFAPLSSGNEIIVPGLSTFTGAFSSVGARYTLKFGKFTKDTYQYAKEPFDVTTQYRTPLNIGFRDCATFVIKGTELLSDSISSDLSTFSTNTSGVYYFSELLEAGVFTAIPYQRPLVDVLYPNITARFTQSVRVSGDNGVDDIDCALYKTTIPSEEDLFGLKTILIELSSRNPQSLTQYVTGNEGTEDLATRNIANGVLYIKDKNGNTNTLLGTLPYLYNRFEQSVITQLSSCVQDFNIVYDTLFIQTSSILVIDKVSYSNSFNSPTTPSRIVYHSADAFNKLSNRYKVDSNVYFTVLSAFNTQSLGNQSIVPILYKYNLTTNKIYTLYPNNTSYVSDNIIPSDTLFTEASTPLISYTSETQTFNLVYIAKDQNKAPTIVFVKFKDVTDGVITNSAYLQLGEPGKTTLFTSLSTLNSFIVPLSSQSITFSTSAMIL